MKGIFAVSLTSTMFSSSLVGYFFFLERGLLYRSLQTCTVLFQVAFVFSEPSSSSAMFSAFFCLQRALGVDYLLFIFVLFVA